jgi:hypothetical protein
VLDFRFSTADVLLLHRQKPTSISYFDDMVEEGSTQAHKICEDKVL